MQQPIGRNKLLNRINLRSKQLMERHGNIVEPVHHASCGALVPRLTPPVSIEELRGLGDELLLLVPTLRVGTVFSLMDR